MKRILLYFSLLLFFTACQEDDMETTLLNDTGTVLDFSGSDCKIVIELDNGTIIQPLYYPDSFIFAEGQRIYVEYTELTTINSACDNGLPCEISYIEELSCSAFSNQSSGNAGTLATDPVFLHEAFVDGDCLYFKLSYSGGCKPHQIELLRKEAATGQDSIPIFEISHTANNDLCEAWITREFRYDISVLRNENISKFELTAPLYNDEIFSRIFTLN